MDVEQIKPSIVTANDSDSKLEAIGEGTYSFNTDKPHLNALLQRFLCRKYTTL